MFLALPRHALSADAKEANPLATIPLRADNDRLYVAYVVVGTPGTAFALALDMRIHGVVVVDAMSLEIKKEHVFTRTSSSTYQPVHVGFEYASGTDVASVPFHVSLRERPNSVSVAGRVGSRARFWISLLGNTLSNKVKVK